MFDSLKQLGNLRQLQKQAKQIQRQLADEEIEIEENGIRVIVSGDQKIKELSFKGESVESSEVMEVINRALEKTRKLAAEKLMGTMKI